MGEEELSSKWFSSSAKPLGVLGKNESLKMKELKEHKEITEPKELNEPKKLKEPKELKRLKEKILPSWNVNAKEEIKQIKIENKKRKAEIENKPESQQQNSTNITEPKKVLRTAAGQVWEDPVLADWNPNDFRIFVGDMGNEVTDQMLQQAFSKYPSLTKVRVVRDRKSEKSKGYGFVGFSDPHEFAKALREMNGKYIGSRPVKLKRSNWKERNAN